MLFLNLISVFLYKVTKARPNDKDAKAKYTECNKIVKKLAFEKAISVSDRCISDIIDFENICK